MPGQAHDVLARLGLELAAQRLELGVGGAGGGEVLPHHDPQLVAQLVQPFGLVQPAAPDAQGVHPGLERVGDARAVVLLGQAGGEAVVGDPVRALGEDRAVVDHDREGGADLVGLLDHPGGAEADPVLAGIEQPLLRIAQLDRHGVPGLVAVAAGPPQLRVRGGQAQVELVVRGGAGAAVDVSAGRVQQAGGEGHGGVVEQVRPLDERRQRDHAAAAADAVVGAGLRGSRRGLDRDLRAHLVQARRGPLLQPDRPGDPAGDQHRSPVPAEVAGHLADRVVGQVVAGDRQRPEHLLVLAGGAQRGAKRISSRFSPSRSAAVMSKRQERCWFCTSAIRWPLSTTVAAVSRESATRSTRSAPVALQSKRVA